MFWEDTPHDKEIQHLDSEILSFNVSIKSLPVDHAQVLSDAILEKVPYLKEHESVGLHTIYGAESGNGWERASEADDVLYPSRRTKMMLQLPKKITAQVIADLEGYETDLLGEKLVFSKPATKMIPKHGTIFSRYVVSLQESEEAFLGATREALEAQGVVAQKMLCGKAHTIQTNTKKLITRSLMLVDLEIKDSVLLQSSGLGAYKLLGCGLFLPHKAVEDTWSNG